MLIASRIVMALRLGMPMLKAKNTKNLTHHDNLQDRVTRCEALCQDQCPRVDHFLIITMLDVTMERHKEKDR